MSSAVEDHTAREAEVLSALRAQLPEHVLLVGDADRDAVMLDALGPQRGYDTKPAVLPLAVICPSTTDQVAAAMRVASEYVVPVVPYGGGTGLMGGARSLQPGIVLDLNSHSIIAGAPNILLTPTEFELLRVLMSEAGRFVSRQRLLDAAWGPGFFGGANVLDVHISQLRRKLRRDAGDPGPIQTLRGVGYCFAEP